MLKERNLQQKDLAVILGTSAQTVTNWVKGHAMPSAATLFEIADQLGVSLDKLIGRIPPGIAALEELNRLDISAALAKLLPDKAVVERVGSAMRTGRRGALSQTVRTADPTGSKKTPGRKKRSKSTKAKKKP